MANTPQYSYLGVLGTSISKNLYLDGRRSLSDSEIEEVTRFINDIRRKLRVHDPKKLRQRFRNLDAKTYLAELNHLAKNTIGAEPIPHYAGALPVLLLAESAQRDPFPRMAGINSFDWEKATTKFLSQMDSLINSSGDVHPGILVAIAASQYQGALHNFGDGNGRLSRLQALIYWPTGVTPEMVSRAMIGSTTLDATRTRSFTDPNISIENNAEVYALGLDEQAVTNRLEIPSSWNSVFPDQPLLAAIIYRHTMGVNINTRSEMLFKILQRYYDIDVRGFREEASLKLARRLELNFTKDEIANFEFASDAVEVHFALQMPVISAYILKLSREGKLDIPYVEDTEPDDIDYKDILSRLAKVSREARLKIAAEQVEHLIDTQRQVLLSDPPVSVRDNLLAVYEDGMAWLSTGIIPEISKHVGTNHKVTWLQDLSAQRPVDIEAINRNIAMWGK